jgi:hypothetical protein
MFVRFRMVRGRLQASILETRRAAGKVVNEHIASLGSIAVPKARFQEDRLLRVIEARPRASIAELAAGCGWMLKGKDGQADRPHKSLTHRVMTRLKASETRSAIWPPDAPASATRSSPKGAFR